MLFLYSRDERPDFDQIGAAIDASEGVAITLGPDEIGPETEIPADLETLWVELHSDGFTFDMSGLAPGAPEPLPQVQGWLDVPTAGRDDKLRCVGLALGPHVRAGRSAMPVLRRLLGIAALIGAQFENCRGICWSASRTVTSRETFIDLVERWLKGGALPAQLFASFSQCADGALESRGMAYFTGQELRIDVSAAADGDQAALLGLRIVGQLIHLGRVDAPEQSMTPDGTIVRIEPSVDGKFVSVKAA